MIPDAPPSRGLPWWIRLGVFLAAMVLVGWLVRR